MENGDCWRGARTRWPEELRGKLHRAAILRDRHTHVLLRTDGPPASHKCEHSDQ
jgi:hypothetical protein